VIQPLQIHRIVDVLVLIDLAGHDPVRGHKGAG
jgi:hypothetical protein